MQQTYNFFCYNDKSLRRKKQLFSANLRRICFLFLVCGQVDKWTSGQVNQLFVDRVSKDRVTGEQGFLKLTSRRVDELTSCLQRYITAHSRNYKLRILEYELWTIWVVHLMTTNWSNDTNYLTITIRTISEIRSSLLVVDKLTSLPVACDAKSLLIVVIINCEYWNMSFELYELYI